MKDKAFFCPDCGSASVEVSELAGSHAVCLVCDWNGKKEDLAAHVFQHDMGSSEEVMTAFIGDFKAVIGQNLARPLAGILHKWGFFKDKPTPAELTKYLIAMGTASIDALLKERSRQEKERVTHGS